MMTYQDIPGWYDWHETYREVVADMPNNSVLVEVGCYLGRSICGLATLMKEYGKRFKIIGVDTCRGSGVENGHDNHAKAIEEGGGVSFAGSLHSNIVKCGFADDIDLIVASSANAAAMFDNCSLDMVFLDAAHDFDSVGKDIMAWLPKVRSGGLMGGDDIGVPGEVNPVWPGVKKAVDLLLPGWRHSPHDAWLYDVR